MLKRSNLCFSPVWYVSFCSELKTVWRAHRHTYQVKPSHAVSGLSVLHIQEEKDVNGSEDEVEKSPPTCWANDVGLLRHHPESSAQPVHAWNNASLCTSENWNGQFVTRRELQLQLYLTETTNNKSELWDESCWIQTYQWLPAPTVWRYAWRAWAQQTWIPTCWPADKSDTSVLTEKALMSS